MRDYLAIAQQYQDDVLNGTIPSCRWVRLACERNRRDWSRQGTDEFPYRFDAAAGARVCQMAEMLPHVKGPKAFILTHPDGSQVKDEGGRPVWNTLQLEPWQCWILTTLFGWKRCDNSLRRFRVSLILIPRKNAKSTLAAVVVLYMLVADGESGAECYSAATTRDQAKTIAEIAWEMARRSPAFREYYGVRMGSETTRSLSVPANGSRFAPLSADAHTLDSLNVSLAAIDELHAHKTAGVWNVLDTATGARPQPLLFAITTAGIDIGGVCHAKMDYLHRVLDGVFVDEAFFGINYTIDQGDEKRIADVTIQRKANPNHGVSVDPDDLQRKIAAAAQSTSDLNNVLTKHFNVWIRTESSWMTGTLWQSCAVPGLTLAQLAQYPCWIGVDLAEVRDIAAAVALFELPGEAFAMIGRFYLPAAAVEKSPIAQLSGWVRDGFIIETAGDQADFERIQNDIVQWCDELQVKEIDFDRALAAQMQQGLKRVLEPRMGPDAVERFVVTVPQDTPTMDGAMKMTERLVLSKKLQHDGNPAMAWMISNVVTRKSDTTDEIRPSKAGGKDSPNKIDGPVAMFTALARAMVGQADAPKYQMFVYGGR